MAKVWRLSNDTKPCVLRSNDKFAKGAVGFRVAQEVSRERKETLFGVKAQGEFVVVCWPSQWVSFRGCSSIGRALHSHCRGRGFEPLQLQW